MSYDDITISASVTPQVFIPFDIASKRVLRKEAAVYGTEASPRQMEVAHTDSVKGRPERHLFKVSTQVANADGKLLNASIHMVITVDPEITSSQRTLLFESSGDSLMALFLNSIGQCDGGGDYVDPTSISNKIAGGFPL